jgi:hypothetical protein
MEVMLDDFSSDWRPYPAATSAPTLSSNGWFTQDRIYLVNEHPRSTIGHIHRSPIHQSRGRRDRSGFVDRF